MSFSDDFNFRRCLESVPNRYAVVNDIGKKARELAKEYDNTIFHSEAISCLINGVKPEPRYVFRDEYEATVIKEMFCYIDDISVKNAVYDSFYKSKHCNNLVYMYNDITDEPRKSRVRVLTRMLWYQLNY